MPRIIYLLLFGALRAFSARALIWAAVLAAAATAVWWQNFRDPTQQDKWATREWGSTTWQQVIKPWWMP